MKVFCTILLFPIIFLLLNNCATVPKEADLKESLRSRAEEYWKKRIEGKFEDTLKMEEKEELVKGNKQGLPLNEYYKAKAMINSALISYSIDNVKIMNDHGRVNVEFVFAMPDMPSRKAGRFQTHHTLTDEWLFQNGKWLHLLP